MSNDNNEFPNGNPNGQNQQPTNQGSSHDGQVDTYTAKRLSVRQKMAIALMAVGGALVAAAIWFTLYNQETIR